eukprot:TRINITY_DN7816_c0_g1_i1.p1 TRINITY_DN7816_c0_g1~~TRINITY_DN7816_c0_g1_i1.p1  ORF type:complete len:730 (-),score=96.67 TRINITY_DN7816_c0_g1_i1:322-2511(-)
MKKWLGRAGKGDGVGPDDGQHTSPPPLSLPPDVSAIDEEAAVMERVDVEDDEKEGGKEDDGVVGRVDGRGGGDSDTDSANAQGVNERQPLLIAGGKALGEKLRQLALDNWIAVVFGACLYIALGLACALVWNDMEWRAYVALFTVAGVIVMLLVDKCEAYVTLLFALTFLLATDVIKPKGALQGFSNPGVIVIAVLFIVAEGISRSRILDILLYGFLGEPRFLVSAVLRVSVPVTIASAVLNNTPLVAMLIPVIENWGKRTGFAPSKLLMPLSFAAMMGGTCTLIGTSTNLIVVGLAEEKDPKFESLNLFEISQVGVPVAVIGVLYMAIFAKFLLPTNEIDTSDSVAHPREYIATVRVMRNSAAVNKPVAESGVKHLPGLFLFAIERDERVTSPVPAETVILVDDVLYFSGVVSSVNLLWDIRGFATSGEVETLARNISTSKRRIVEAAVSPHSPLVGRSVKKARFPLRYGAAVLAVHRHGERIQTPLSDIVLRPGDALLLLTHPRFSKEHADNTEWALVRDVCETTAFRKLNYAKMLVSLSLASFMIAIATADVLPLLTAAMIAAATMILTQCMSLATATRAVNIPVILTVAAAFGIADAMETTGAASRMAQTLIDLLQPLGPLGMLAGLYFATALMGAFISNAASAALMFPIIYAVQQEDSNLTLKSSLYVLMLAASSSFSTSIGYQTNLMVCGPGGYRMKDFVKFGLPLQLLCGVTSVVLCWVIFG